MAGLTADPSTVCESVDSNPARIIEYRDLVSGERWNMIGMCNQCGLCCIGAVGSFEWDPMLQPGEPGSLLSPSLQNWKDSVARPGIVEDTEQMATQLGYLPAGSRCVFTFTVLPDVEGYPGSQAAVYPASAPRKNKVQGTR